MSVSVCCAVLSPDALSSAARPAVPAPAYTAGRHRRTETAGTGVSRAVEVLAQLGNLVAAASLLLVATAATLLVHSMPINDVPTLTVTFDHSGR